MYCRSLTLRYVVRTVIASRSVTGLSLDGSREIARMSASLQNPFSSALAGGAAWHVRPTSRIMGYTEHLRFAESCNARIIESTTTPRQGKLTSTRRLLRRWRSELVAGGLNFSPLRRNLVDGVELTAH